MFENLLQRWFKSLWRNEAWDRHFEKFEDLQQQSWRGESYFRRKGDVIVQVLLMTNNHHHWLDSPWWALAFLRSRVHSSLSRAAFFQFWTSSVFISWLTPFSHRSFGLTPSGLVLNTTTLSRPNVYACVSACVCMYVFQSVRLSVFLRN
jgi:hypothetical protein